MVYGQGNPALLASGGELTNPSDEALAADTGALAAGLWEFRVTAGASAAADIRCERRNAANGATVGAAPVLKLPAGQSGQYIFRSVMEASERFRVLLDDALTGTIAVTINYEKLF